MNRIFECLGEFGLVDQQYALLDYFYLEIIENKESDFYALNKDTYIKWLDTLRDDEIRKAYLSIVINSK
jgi:hypothetical protein